MVAHGLLAWAGLGAAVYAGVKYGPKYLGELRQFVIDWVR